MGKFAYGAAAVAFGVLTLVGLPAQAGDTDQRGSAQAGGTARVSMDRNLFTPQVLRIRPGTSVEWINDEKRTSHSVFFETEGLAESDRLFPGESWTRTFDKPGTYPYHCGPHPEMVGTVEVAP